MAYLPKGIGDMRLAKKDLKIILAGMAYLPKGIGDSEQLRNFLPAILGRNGLPAERHW